MNPTTHYILIEYTKRSKPSNFGSWGVCVRLWAKIQASSQNCKKRLLASSHLSVRPSVRPPAWNNSAPTKRIFIKFDIWIFFENLSPKFKFQYNRTIITGTLHDDQCTFLIISRSFLLRTKNVSDRCCRGNQNTRFMLWIFFPGNCAVYEIILKECGRSRQATDDRQ